MTIQTGSVQAAILFRIPDHQCVRRMKCKRGEDETLSVGEAWMAVPGTGRNLVKPLAGH